MKKYNLSVPDALAEKIEARRKQLGSLSALFRHAVAEKIEHLEEFETRLKGDETMMEIIERLKKEKRAAQTDYLEKGRADGLAWAKAASYMDLEYALPFDPKDEDGLYDPTIPLHDEILGHYFLDTLEADPLTNPEDDEDELNEFAKQWLKGWLEAVRGFWREVADKI